MQTQETLRVYKDLADHYERQGQPAMRDRFLVLAADAAMEAGSAAEAERLRQRLLQANPHHLLKPYKSFAEAIGAPDVQTYVRDLRLNYPLETAENLLRSLRAENLLDSLRQEKDAVPAPKPRQVPAPTAEPPVVYRLHPEDPPPRKPGAAAEPPYQPAPYAAPRDNGGRKNAPLAQPAAPAKPPRAAPPARPAVPEPEAPASGAWFASALFGFFVVACAALAVYTLARPFLPAEWLR
jgi:hypothetical protein